jgi:hypothetical protein
MGTPRQLHSEDTFLRGRIWHEFPFGSQGRARQLCPSSSDLDLLRDIQRVVDLDAEVAGPPDVLNNARTNLMNLSRMVAKSALLRGLVPGMVQGENAIQ